MKTNTKNTKIPLEAGAAPDAIHPNHNTGFNLEQKDINRINSFTPDDWKPLLSLIPEIEKTTFFGECVPSKQMGENGYSFPYWSSAPVVDRFLKRVYSMPVIVHFKWSAWDDGREMAFDEDFDFNSINIASKCKLITAIVRSDRFSDGALIEAFDSGLILKLLKSINQQLMVNQINERKLS